jgi:NMD protein affecting ribosome stability and mRNA decay
MPKSTILRKDLYFEANIQLRPFDKEVFDWILKQIAKRPKVFVSKFVEYKTGIDIFISDQRFARRLGKKLNDTFKGDLKITRTLFTQDKMTSKLVYRGTVLFRLKPKETK